MDNTVQVLLSLGITSLVLLVIGLYLFMSGQTSRVSIGVFFAAIFTATAILIGLIVLLLAINLAQERGRAIDAPRYATPVAVEVMYVGDAFLGEGADKSKVVVFVERRRYPADPFDIRDLIMRKVLYQQLWNADAATTFCPKVTPVVGGYYLMQSVGDGYCLYPQ